MSNAGTPKLVRFEEDRAKLELATTAMEGKTDLQEAALIVMNGRPELAITGKLLTRTALASIDCSKVVIEHGECEGRSASKVIGLKLPVEITTVEQGPSGSGKKKKARR